MRKVATRARSMPKAPTYSKSANPAVLDFGIYQEHGMVDSSDGKSVRPQCKRSREFYESLL
jgi:hypothetical protein